MSGSEEEDILFLQLADLFKMKNKKEREKKKKKKWVRELFRKREEGAVPWQAEHIRRTSY